MGTSQSNKLISSNYSSRMLSIDFSFNLIKNVKKVCWKEEAPWFREINDGFCWLCYCMNTNCDAYGQLVVINRGYAAISKKKEMMILVCPVCSQGNQKVQPTLKIRNCGFVNCEWAMRGVLMK